MTPYRPPTYSSQVCRLFNLICSRQISCVIPLGQETLTICLEAGSAATFSEDARPPCLAFQVQDALWQIRLEATRPLYFLLEHAGGPDLFSGFPAESLPDDIIRALLEAYLTPGLSLLESVIKHPVTLAAPDTPSESDGFPVSLNIRMTANTEICVCGTLSIPVTDPCITLMETLVSRCPLTGRSSDPAIRHLKKQILFLAGSLRISYAELLSLEAGDVLIPEIWYPDQGRMLLHVGPDQILCDFNPETLAVTLSSAVTQTATDTDRIQPPGARMTENKTPPDTATDPPAPTDDPLIPISRIDMDIVFEVGRLTLTLEDIGRLSAGQILSLPHRLEDGVPVAVRTSGQLIAQGKIVGMDEYLAIQITRKI